MMDIDRLKRLAGLQEQTNISRRDIEDVLFGDLKRSKEADTDKEADYFSVIELFISDSTPLNKQRASSVLRGLMYLKQYYPDDLVPRAKTAYRGTQLGDNTYTKLAAQHADAKGWLELDHKYTPRSDIQSWTVKKQIALDFAINGNIIQGLDNRHYNVDSKYNTPAVISTAINDDFVMTAKLTNAIAMQQHHVAEYETVRISRQPVACKLIIHSDWLRHYASHQNARS